MDQIPDSQIPQISKPVLLYDIYSTLKFEKKKKLNVNANLVNSNILKDCFPLRCVWNKLFKYSTTQNCCKLCAETKPALTRHSIKREIRGCRSSFKMLPDRWWHCPENFWCRELSYITCDGPTHSSEVWAWTGGLSRPSPYPSSFPLPSSGRWRGKGREGTAVTAFRETRPLIPRQSPRSAPGKGQKVRRRARYL